MTIMPYREKLLQATNNIYETCHVSLVSSHGSTLIPAGYGDDIGIYYFIPKLAHLTGLNLDLVIVLFFGGLLLLALCMGILGSLLLFKTLLGRLLAVGVLSMTVFAAYVAGDLYVIATAITIGLLPLFLYLIKLPKYDGIKIIFLLLAGISIGFAHYIRSFSSAPTLVFMFMMLIFNSQLTIKLKSILIAALSTGIFLSTMYFAHLMYERDNYLKQHVVGHPYGVTGHPLWHSIYIGFGYLNNPYGITYSDTCGFKKAQSINHEVVYMSPQYGEIIKRETYKFVASHPVFVIKTIIAKAIALFWLLPWYLLIAVIFSIFFPKGWLLELSFIIAILLSALPGILVTPFFQYMLGYVAIVTIYMLVSVNYAFESNKVKNIYKSLS